VQDVGVPGVIPKAFEMLMKIQRVLAEGIRGLYAGWSGFGKMIRPICIVLVCLLLESCTKPSAHEPVTLIFVEEWSNKTFSEARQQELREFTQETGIRVSLLPSPESARQKLVLWRELLGTGASGPDVYSVDVIWPGMLAEYFVDLKPYGSLARPGAAQLFSSPCPSRPRRRTHNLPKCFRALASLGLHD
jgi:ABC-type glycerol-3-phosphate transport system substrate-binding protein